MVQRFDAVSIFENLPLIGERVVSTTDHIIFEVAELSESGVLVSEIGSEVSLITYRSTGSELRTFDISSCRFPTIGEYNLYKTSKTV